MKPPLITISWREVRFPRWPIIDRWLHNNEWNVIWWMVVIDLLLLDLIVMIGL